MIAGRLTRGRIFTPRAASYSKKRSIKLIQGPNSIVARSLSCSHYNSSWNSIPLAPPDKILGITEAFVKDANSKKINLGVGAYRDNSGKPIILKSVSEAETILSKQESDKEYAPILGTSTFRSLVQNFIFSHDQYGASLVKEKKIVTAQSLSGTGGLRLIAEFLAKFNTSKTVLLPKPTWVNHLAIFEAVGITPQYYRYFNPEKNGLDIEGFKNSLLSAEEGTIVLLHPCCHNPTGIDLKKDQWDDILEIVKSKKLFPIIDMAYQGFSSGDPVEDLYLVNKINKYVVDRTIESYALCQSFAKNMGLYGERVGSLSLVTNSPSQAVNIESQLKKVVRPIYSSPPIHGSKIVEIILSNPDLLSQWLSDVNTIVSRLQKVRIDLYERLDKTNFNWDHLLDQHGMFCFTGLNPQQIKKLRDEYSVYATDDGRFSIAGINDSNVDYLAHAINKVVRDSA